ncbi:MAG: signal peptidase I [Chloroflexi bacterium]|nr:signal peptidase I [Chloroflexota bacterium]
MAELSGSLTSVEIGSLVRFLCGLGKSGDVLVSDSHWIGQLSLSDGRLTAATFNEESGAAALEFIVLALGSADFEFSEGAPTQAPNLDGPDALAYLDRLVSNRRERRIQLPRPGGVPYVLQPTAGAALDEELKFDRLTLYLLLDIDGVHTVRDLADRHGILRTLRSLLKLAELGLIGFTERPTPNAPPPPSPSPDSSDQAARRRAAPGGTQRGTEPPEVLRRIKLWRSESNQLTHRLLGNELLKSIALTGALMLTLRTVVENFRVDGISMEPTFATGQALVINRAAYFHVGEQFLFGGPQRGDIVVFRAPPEPDLDYIKRVIGLPGDTILIRDGTVFINGEPLTEPYIQFRADYVYPADGTPLQVPSDNYFVLGDNRPDSFDSHTGWMVPLDNLIGRALVRYWPPSEAQVVRPGSTVTVHASASSPSAAR